MHVYSELLKEILKKRGIIKEKEIDSFLNLDYGLDLHDPFLMHDMDKACKRIYSAIKNNEKIIIYSDYDSDGIPGAVIFFDLLKKLNYENFEIYIPERNSEGYGLNIQAINEFKEKNVKLLITIDLGIGAIEEISLANSFKIDTIILDHHLPHIDLEKNIIKLPDAYAILNPKVDDYPEKMLCGAGVVFKFVQGFIKKYKEEFNIKEGWEKWMLDMAGLATLSDMVPLLGENRAIAYFGLKVLRKSPRLGLQELLKKMNINQKYLSEDDIGFMVAPRINAASRMDSPMRAFELLATKDSIEAGILASHLSKVNDERKNIVLNIMKQVKKNFEKRETIKESSVIVMGNPSWRVGVLGIVASKIMDEYNKPVFIWGKDENDIIKGSCRSPGDVSLIELMTISKEFFLEFGGHELAGGFTVHDEKIHFLEKELSLSFEKVKKEKKDSNIEYDIKGDLSLVNMKNWKEIEKISPFGYGNPKPIFFFQNVKIENIKKFGKNGSGEHLEIIFSQTINDRKIKVISISFFSDLNSFNIPIEKDLKVNLLATFDLSRFKGREELRLRIVDII